MVGVEVGKGKHSRVTEMSHLLFMRMVVPLHTVVRTQTVHLKCLHFIGCKLDICECVFFLFLKISGK